MLLVRSVIFNILFYLNLAVLCIAALPTLLMPRWGIVGIARLWGRINLWLLRVVCDIKVEYRGLEKLPRGPLIVAAKHQSAWETFVLLLLVDKPTYILKRELMWLPFFGWYTIKAQMIPIDRSAGGQTLIKLAEGAKQKLADDFQILIFPEGTRRPAGAEPRYKYGVAHLYSATGAQCVPVALNSGLFWPRRSFLRYPGTVVVEILDPIAPGLGTQEFFARVQNDIETATARLIAEGERELAGKGIRAVSLAASDSTQPSS